MQDQIDRAERTQAVGRLATGVAHDFNNYLQVIQGQLDLAADGTEPWDASTTKILKSIKSASNLTRQLMVLGNDRDFELQPLNINDWLSSGKELLESALPSDIALEVNINSDEPRLLLADPHQMQQMLLNLVINARDAIESSDVSSGIVKLHLNAQRETIQIAVEDNGCGMENDTIARIFEPFYTTKPHDRGTGLGLAGVLAIVHRHGGDITVTSTAGEGSTFTISLPSSPLPSHLPSHLRFKL